MPAKACPNAARKLEMSAWACHGGARVFGTAARASFEVPSAFFMTARARPIARGKKLLQGFLRSEEHVVGLYQEQRAVSEMAFGKKVLDVSSEVVF